MNANEWEELHCRLSQPFPASLVKWRAGATSRDTLSACAPQGGTGKMRAQALAYAPARVYEDRLNLLCPGAWEVTFEPWSELRLICSLTLCGLTRSSTGESDGKGFAVGTSAEAQAFKRACSKFGLGRYLYDLPTTWVAYDSKKRQLAEVPRLPERFVPPTLSRECAAELHRELGRLGVGDHYAHAARLLGRSLTSFTELTEDEAARVLDRAKRQPVSDEEALAILG